MTVSVPLALVVAMYVTMASSVWAQTAEPSWKPDEATVKSIEATLTLPSTAPWKPGPLDSYVRHYVGMMKNGNKIVHGDLLRGQHAKEKPGIYLSASPTFLFGGGCDHIQLWYDVDAHRMLQMQCYGMG